VAPDGGDVVEAAESPNHRDEVRARRQAQLEVQSLALWSQVAVHRLDADTVVRQDLEHARGVPVGDQVDVGLDEVVADRRHELRADPPQQDEDDQHEERRDDRAQEEAGAGGHADRRDDPQRRGGRDAANGDALADDRARAEEPDARDDLRGDSRRVGLLSVRGGELRESVGGDEGEQRGAEADERVGAQAGDLVARGPLEADDAAQDHGREQPDDEIGVVDPDDAGGPHHCRVAGGAGVEIGATVGYSK
jgi:hypothetical protein